jgi:hypothetical protein
VVVSKRPGTLVIGFAAETENLIEHGRDKLLRKGADAIVLNDVSRPGIGFDSDRNAATFLTPKTAIELPEMTKHELAGRILDEVIALRRPASVVAETGFFIFRCSLRPESSQEHLPTSIAEVLRLRAIKPSVCDRYAKRFAQRL